ncbi:MAG: hypothetical protein II180_14515, partial [Proteobacteria bacterium]|nr:hypothetical protein [Pseudomonadota bacterium]
VCQATACDNTYHVYNGGCEADDVINCSSHGNACHYDNGTGACASATCSLASCNTGFHKYGNVCEENNIAHCGAHGTTCTTANVDHSSAVECTSGGACQATACVDGFHVDNGACVEDQQGGGNEEP